MRKMQSDNHINGICGGCKTKVCDMENHKETLTTFTIKCKLCDWECTQKVDAANAHKALGAAAELFTQDADEYCHMAGHGKDGAKKFTPTELAIIANDKKQNLK